MANALLLSQKYVRMKGGVLLGLFIGILVGMIATAAIVFYIQKTPLPFSTKPPTNAQSASQVATAQTQPATIANPSAPVALPGKPGDAPSDKDRFDFYKILPNNEATQKDKEGAKKDAKEIAKDKDEKPVFLQAGAFQSAEDADNQKAKLAFLGVEASVQQVMLQDKTWYRVRLGPFAKAEEANKKKSELSKQGVETNVVK